MIQLHPEQIQQVLKYSTEMQKYNQEHHTTNYRQSTKYTDLEITRQGFTGEAVVYKYLNRWEDFERRMNRPITAKTKDDNIDITISCDGEVYNCDIKSTFFKRPDRLGLTRRHKREMDKGNKDMIDAYILVTVEEDFTGGRIVGLVSTVKVKNHISEEPDQTGYYAVPIEYLTPIDELVENVDYII